VPQRASLLGIPAELRNRIWRLALLPSGTIRKPLKFHFAEERRYRSCHNGRSSFWTIGHPGCRHIAHDGRDYRHHGIEHLDCENLEPGLLSTCRQIRNETCKIFRQENEFILCVGSFWDIPQRHHWYWTGSANVHLQIEAPSRSIHWSDLEKWIELYYLGLWSGDFGNGRAGQGLIKPAIKLVDVLRGLPWEQVHAALTVLMEAHVDWEGECDAESYHGYADLPFPRLKFCDV